MAEKEVKITITASSRDAKRAFREISEAAKKASDSISSSGDKGAAGFEKIRQSGKKAQDSVTGLSGALKGLGAMARAAALGGVAKSIADLGLSAVKAASQMRQYEIAFQTLLKSADEGTRMLQDLQKFAAETPFDVPGVVEAAQQLLAFGFNAKEIIPTLRVLGDTAAGLGKSTAGVQQIAYALGQIRTSGTLKTQDMNQLTNAGISAWEILAQKAGKSVLEIKEMTEKGMIDSTKAVEVLTQGMTERFGGMMEKTAQEVRGLWSNITESVYNAQASIGAFATDALGLKDVLKTISESVGSMSDKLMQARNAGKDFGEAIKTAFPPELTIAVGALAAVIGVTLVGALGAAVAALGTLTGISAPVVAVVAGLGAAIANAFNNKDDYEQKVIDELRELGDGANEYAEALQKAVDARKELASYSTYDSDYHDRIGEPEKATNTGTVDLTNGKTKQTTKSAESIQRAIATARRESASLSKDLIQLQNDLLMAGLSGDARVIQGIHNERDARLASLQEVLEKQKAAVTEAEAIRAEALKAGHQAEIDDATKLLEEKKALLQESLNQEAEIKEQIRQVHTDQLASMVTEVQQAWRNYANSIASGFGNAVGSMIEGSKSASQAMKELLKSIIVQAAQTAAQFLMLAAILKAFKVPNAGAVAVQMMFGVNPEKIGTEAATGGYISGPGTGTSDSIPAMLSNGEYVVRASAVRKIGVPALNAINAGRGFADGGVVDAGAFASHPVANSTKNENRTANISLNVSAVDAESFAGFLRNGGLDEIRQALFDNNRNFGDLAGVW